MQWAPGKNLGFSEADPSALYLPVDKCPDAPTVQTQQDDPDSILNTVKALISLRQSYADLNADGQFEVIHAKSDDPLFAYRRGSLFLFANPGDTEATLDWQWTPASGNVVFSIGRCTTEKSQIALSPQSFAIVQGLGARG